jgi:hypothetical protein
MSLIVPHTLKALKRHDKLPYLWRAICSCGWSAFAGTEPHIRAAFQQHIVEEEPFPADDIFDTTKGPHSE